jgi:hypothetical protein
MSDPACQASCTPENTRIERTRSNACRMPCISLLRCPSQLSWHPRDGHGSNGLGSCRTPAASQGDSPQDASCISWIFWRTVRERPFAFYNVQKNSAHARRKPGVDRRFNPSTGPLIILHPMRVMKSGEDAFALQTSRKPPVHHRKRHMNVWTRVLRLFAVMAALSKAAFEMVSPHLPFPGTILTWISANHRFKSLEETDEPDARTRLVSGIRKRVPAWSSVRHASMGVEIDAWSNACRRLQTYRAFLERALSRGEDSTSEVIIEPVRSRILETCALHLDFMIFMRAALGDVKAVANIRSLFTKHNPRSSFVAARDAPDQTSIDMVKRIWKTLLSETPSRRLENMLLLDTWSAVEENFGQRRAAAAAVYSMLLFDFFRECGDASNEEQVSALYWMVVEGASAAATDSDVPFSGWFSQLAALTLGMSGRPKARC